MRRTNLIVAAFLTCLFSTPLIAEQPKGPQHGLELYGSPKYPKDFKSFDYVNPRAPKGGELILGGVGTFDSLNPFVIKGTPAGGMHYVHPSYFYATLMTQSFDESSSAYGYIAETAEVAEDAKSVTFSLRESAKFHDGTPIMAEDVVFSFDTFKAKGNPFFKSYYRKIQNAEVLGPRKVRFNFTVNDDKELALIIGELVIISKAFYAKNDFTKSSLNMPLGSGPYKIENVDAGKSIIYSRVKDWWGKDLPVNKGRYNFDTIKIIYFLDPTVALQAFKAGDVNFRVEATAKNWATGYDSPALDRGDYIKQEIPHSMPWGMSGLILNIRKPLFQDINVRKALALAYDFEWANKNLFYNTYKRSNSYFSNCELAAVGLPQGDELKILEPFKAQVPAEVFTQEFKMPANKDGHDFRKQLKKCQELLFTAGWEIKGGALVNKKTGKPFEFEILLSRADMARPFNSYVQSLGKLGIKANIRIVDSAQYQERIDDFDYDAIFDGFMQSNNPGNEQEEYFGSRVVNSKGSKNYIGIASPVIDALIEEIINAQNRQDLINHVHVLDRVLLWNYYVVPGWYMGAFRIAHWRNIHSPGAMPKYNFDLDSWWYEEAKI